MPYKTKVVPALFSIFDSKFEPLNGNVFTLLMNTFRDIENSFIYIDIVSEHVDLVNNLYKRTLESLKGPV